MKTKCLLGALLAAATFTAPAFGQISVYIGTPPPPIRYEVPPPMPEVGYVWVPGYWAPYGGRYVWAPGRWSRPPYYGADWRGGGWDHDDHGWRYREGYWVARGRGWRDRDWDDDDDDGPGNRGRGHAYGHYKDRDEGRGHGHGHGHDRD